MTEKTKKSIKIILPIIVGVVLILSFLLILLIPKQITAKTYFSSLTNSNFTKQTQQTTLLENDNLVYEKLETMIFNKNNVYHKIEEKVLSSSPLNTYDITINEYYYTKDKIYYKENNVWKTEDFVVKENIKTYSLKTNYFENLQFDKKFEEIGILTGKILDENVNTVFNTEVNYTNVLFTIKINNKLKINECQITALTSLNRNVNIINTYSYNTEQVILPEV